MRHPNYNSNYRDTTEYLWEVPIIKPTVNGILYEPESIQRAIRFFDDKKLRLVTKGIVEYSLYGFDLNKVIGTVQGYLFYKEGIVTAHINFRDKATIKLIKEEKLILTASCKGKVLEPYASTIRKAKVDSIEYFAFIPKPELFNKEKYLNNLIDNITTSLRYDHE